MSFIQSMKRLLIFIFLDYHYFIIPLIITSVASERQIGMMTYLVMRSPQASLKLSPHLLSPALPPQDLLVMADGTTGGDSPTPCE